MDYLLLSCIFSLIGNICFFIYHRKHKKRTEQKFIKLSKFSELQIGKPFYFLRHGQIVREENLYGILQKDNEVKLYYKYQEIYGCHVFNINNLNLISSNEDGLKLQQIEAKEKEIDKLYKELNT